MIDFKSYHLYENRNTRIISIGDTIMKKVMLCLLTIVATTLVSCRDERITQLEEEIKQLKEEKSLENKQTETSLPPAVTKETNTDMVPCDNCFNQPLKEIIPGLCPGCLGTTYVQGVSFPIECPFCVHGECYKCKGTKEILRSQIGEPLPLPEVIAAEREVWKRTHSTGGIMSSRTCDECSGSGLMYMSHGYMAYHECDNIYCQFCGKKHCSSDYHDDCWKCGGHKVLDD